MSSCCARLLVPWLSHYAMRFHAMLWWTVTLWNCEPEQTFSPHVVSLGDILVIVMGKWLRQLSGCFQSAYSLGCLISSMRRRKSIKVTHSIVAIWNLRTRPHHHTCEWLLAYCIRVAVTVLEHKYPKIEKILHTWMVISKISKAVGSSGVDRDFLWLCSFEICIHLPLKKE